MAILYLGEKTLESTCRQKIEKVPNQSRSGQYQQRADSIPHSTPYDSRWASTLNPFPGGNNSGKKSLPLVLIGASTPPLLERWRISTKEFREDLEWAVIVPGTSEISPAVAQLLDELSVRGIIIHDSSLDFW